MQYVLCITLITIVFAYIVFRQYMKPIEVSLAYGLTQRYIQQLTYMYLSSKVFPLMMIPENEFTADELKMHRDECIKFVLTHIKSLPIYKIISTVYDDELIALMVDNEFVKKTALKE